MPLYDSFIESAAISSTLIFIPLLSQYFIIPRFADAIKE